MSIINQTLRELDARKKAFVSPGVALRPVAALPGKPKWWGGAIALLLAAGLLLWIVSRPGDSPALSGPASPTPAKPGPVAAAADPVPAPLPAEGSASVPGSAESDVPGAAGPTKPSQVQDAPGPAGSAPLPELSLRLKVATNVGSPATIRKEVNEPTAEEEADEQYRKAIALMQKGRESQARTLLEEAIRVFPAHLSARQTLATRLGEAGHNQEAETVLREGLAVAPDNAWFLLSLARLQAARGDMEGAAATLQSGVDGPAVNAEYRATLAALLMQLKRHPEAARHYTLALEQQPGQATWWMGLGLALEAQGQIDEARSAYGRALTTGSLPDRLQEYVRAKVAE